jgi:predicted O-linked N-acetylglucosamine transferase (SPINDLY family)
LKPADPEIAFAFGDAARLAGDPDSALAAFRNAIARDPDHARAHAGIGAILADRRDFRGARAAIERALARDPRLAEAHLTLGVLRLERGDAEAAVAADRESVRLAPSLDLAHSNLVQHMSYAARYSAAEILAEARGWNARHAAPLAAKARPFVNPRDPDKRLKVGYVGGDFRAHPVGAFFAAFLPHHDPKTVETFVYMTGPEIDSMTESLRARARHWRAGALMDDAAVAEAARQDGIDILVDAAGHTAHNRLLAFARRAAPVQATGFGVTGTTGLAAMDYFLGDRFEIPPGYERFYSEAVVRLPHDNVCFAPVEYAPPVAILPSRAQGFVTFGSFNMAGKVTPETVALWARVLEAVPNARFLMKNVGLQEPECRDRFRRLFADAGVAEDRVTLEGPSSHAELLAAYGRVDIALDPVPYSGGLTTLESLWMGVPVVARPGETFASRHSASHLANAGLPELVAARADDPRSCARGAHDYVAIAVRLASDLDALERLRASLRAKVAASPLCDGALYAKGLEAAYREMWRRWCAGEEPRALNVPPP